MFVVATYGEGEPTDNMREFQKQMMSPESAQQPLSNLSYAVFALGNRQYELFCAAGRAVDRRMEELGAKRVIKLGEGDDDASLEDDFAQWKQQFWGAAVPAFHTPEESEAIWKRVAGKGGKFSSSFSVEMRADDGKQSRGAPFVARFADSRHRADVAVVKDVRELRQKSTPFGLCRIINVSPFSCVMFCLLSRTNKTCGS